MRETRVLLIGQPNVGKSSLLNALVGSRVIVSDYPGTTVEVTRADKVYSDTRIAFLDTPGLYSISDRSEEEKLTERALFEERSDSVILVVDASALERSLYLALQILEAGKPMVIALNFVEEAAAKGITVDPERLEGILGVPVVPINPLKKTGIDRLLDALVRLETPAPFEVRYDDHIEQAIDLLSSRIAESPLPRRFVAIRILEMDSDFYPYLEADAAIDEAHERLLDHPRVEEDISITRYGTASFIAEKVTQILHVERREKVPLQERFDSFFFHRITGTLATWAILLGIFALLLYLGSAMQDLLLGATERLLEPLASSGGSIVSTILIQAASGVAAGVSIALPYVFLFYFILGFLEDVGLLTRLIVTMEGFLKRLGLPGKAFIPLALGLGCTVPAVRATRVLSSEKSKRYTASLFVFVPCSSRIAIIMGVVGYYGSKALAFYVLATSFLAASVWALCVRRLLRTRGDPLLLQLPPYRRPIIGNILTKSWIRMRDFVYIVIPLLAVGGILYAILERFDMTWTLVRPFAPITAWLGLPEKTIVPLIFGFLQKDLSGAMLVSVLGSDLPSQLTSLQIYTFGVAATIGVPCIIALGMFIKELGYRSALLLLVGSAAYGLVVAGLAQRIASLFL